MSEEHRTEIERAQRLAAEGRVEAAVDLLSSLLQSAPDDLDLLFALGVVARNAGLLDDAERAYRAVLERRPNAVEAAVNLANVLVAKGDTAPALRILSRIHALAPQLLPATLALGAALLAAGDTAAALALYDRVLAEQPGLAQAHANRAEVLARLGRHRESLESVERARHLAPDDPRIAFNLAIALLTEGRLDEGLAAYEARLAPGLPTAPIREGLALPRWEGGSLPNGPLLVVAEQGVGDEIRFAASAWALARDGIPLIIEADSRLVTLFQRSLPGARVAAHDRRRSGVRPIYRYEWLSGVPRPPVAWIEAGSLPQRLRFPRSAPVAPEGYIQPDPTRVAAFREWRANLDGSGPVVGVVWGSAAQGAERRRFYPPLAAWGPVLSLPGVRFVDLQYVDSTADRAVFRQLFGVEILPVDDLDKRNDLEGAAALAAALDAVVGVSSSVTTLAGAAGTPAVEVIGERSWLPKTAGCDSWLGPVRPVEAERPGDWADSMGRAAALLMELMRRP